MQYSKCKKSCTAAGTRKLFKMMLGTDSEFVNKFFAARKYWDINVGQWTASGGVPASCTHKALVKRAMLYSAHA